MMVLFFAQRVILNKSDFKATYGDPKFIPPSLKSGVAETLIESGLPELVPTEYGGTLTE